MKGYYYERELVTDFPFWSLKYYFKEEHIQLHKRFFKGYVNYEILPMVRVAFRKEINEEKISFDSSNFGVQDKYHCSISVNDEVINENFHFTKLMKIQKKVIERFYGEQFDINDSDTWTKQIIIVDWLKKEFGLSNREAQAIDMITRPESARGK